MNFKIEQIAICPNHPGLAKALLKDMGAAEWIEDTVTALGNVLGEPRMNTANLSFNYDLFDGKEFEILDYTKGENWMQRTPCPSVSHLGMHCTNEELLKWREFFAKRGYKIAQEVFTQSHTNEAIAGKRRYNYVIFDTRAVLGVDIKFIVRMVVDNVA